MDSRQYAELFRTESREQLSAVNRALLRLEQGDASRESVDAVFRGVHTIKGMSATMGYTAVAEFAHELESLLDKVRKGAQTITAELMDALFVAADALEHGVERPGMEAAMSTRMREALARLHDVAGGRSTAEFRTPLLHGPAAQDPGPKAADAAAGSPEAMPTRVSTSRSDGATELFADVIAGTPQAALLLDADGLVSAGQYLTRDGTDMGTPLGAHLSGVSVEAERAMRHFGLGRWTRILLESDAASVVMSPVGDGVALVAAPRDLPLGFVRRTVDRCAAIAREWLGVA